MRRHLSLEQQAIERLYIKNTFCAEFILNMIWSACAFNLAKIGLSYKDIRSYQEFDSLIEAGLLLGFLDDGGMYHLLDNILPYLHNKLKNESC